jgi:hypothetical protein
MGKNVLVFILLVWTGTVFGLRGQFNTVADVSIYGYPGEDTLNAGGKTTVKIKQRTQHIGFFKFDLSSISTATITACSLVVFNDGGLGDDPAGVRIQIWLNDPTKMAVDVCHGKNG